MASLLGIRIQNFRSLRDITLGQIGYEQGDPLPAAMCFIGPNGSGKSSLLDAFAFMADCLAEGIEAACDKSNRGGFQESGNTNAVRAADIQAVKEMVEEGLPLGSLWYSNHFEDWPL